MDVLAPLDERPLRGEQVEAAFAAYLSSRVDLLSHSEALELATMSRSAVLAPYGAVRERFAREAGRNLEQVFGSFEAEPFDSDLLFQWHRARLENGEGVVFKIAHSEVDDRLEENLDRLHELEPSSQRRRRLRESQAVADFKSFLLRSLDLGREAEDLIELRDRCEDMSLVAIPEVHREFSGERFLTLSDLGGATVAERCYESPPNSSGGGQRLARRLCRAWLRLVLSAATVPVNPSGRNVLLLNDGKIAFCGGPFQGLSGQIRDQLRDYMAATSTADHGSLVEALLKLCHPFDGHEERCLRREIRHTAPFRDGGWSSDSDSLSSSLLAHWHQAAALGCRPRRALLTFLRGLTLLTREAGSLAPGENSFREAFQELRLYQLFAESTRFATVGEMASIADLPRKLERGLTLAAGDGARPLREKTKDDSAGSWSIVLALVSALAAVAVLVHHVAPPAADPNWIERSGAAVFLVLGGLLLVFATD